MDLSVGSEVHPLPIARELGGWLPAGGTLNKLLLFAAHKIGEVDTGHLRLQRSRGRLEVGVNELRSIGTPGRLVPSGTTFRYQTGALAGRQVHDPKLLHFPFTDLIGELLAVGESAAGPHSNPLACRAIARPRLLETGCRQR